MSTLSRVTVIYVSDPSILQASPTRAARGFLHGHCPVDISLWEGKMLMVAGRSANRRQVLAGVHAGNPLSCIISASKA